MREANSNPNLFTRIILLILYFNPYEWSSSCYLSNASNRTSNGVWKLKLQPLEKSIKNWTAWVDACLFESTCTGSRILHESTRNLLCRHILSLKHYMYRRTILSYRLILSPKSCMCRRMAFEVDSYWSVLNIFCNFTAFSLRFPCPRS